MPTPGGEAMPTRGRSIPEGEVPTEVVTGAPRSADDILELIFTPTPRASPAEQAERTLRRPKALVYVAMSNRTFFWRQQLTKFVLDEGRVPITPFMMFDYYLLHTVPKELVREAMNNLIARCEEMWVFGSLSLGLKVQVGIAKRMRKPVRYFDISDLPYRVVGVPESMVAEER
ncbi:MAG TPA: hypothetical protein VMV12_06335 [Candidatus Micrarchaeaceae archaeon]|nr:hypothetical protein [Candidatus Micrarchaeaceae archaeon]